MQTSRCSGISTSTDFRLCSRAPSSSSSRRRRLDCAGAPGVDVAAAVQVVGGQRARRAQRVGRAVEHDLAAALAGAGTDVEHPVGGEHHLRIVLDDDQRVARVAQALHHADDAAHVARVQTDRRLVEHEQRVDQRGAERGRQVDALDLAAGQRARLAVERQVAEPDVAEETQPRANLGEEQVGGLVQRGWQRQRVEEAAQPFDRQQHQVVQRQPGHRVEPFAAAMTLPIGRKRR